jgi:hypothetical protein
LEKIDSIVIKPQHFWNLIGKKLIERAPALVASVAWPVQRLV